jgi:nicotinamide-nucleotide amidase
MAVGVRERLQVDVGVSVTGIAGPGGGTPEKPVGLTFIGLADRAGGHAERFLWTGDRGSNREESVLAALRMLIAWAEGQD